MQRSNQLCSLVLILGLASLCSIEVAAAELYKLVNRGALQQRIAALYTAEESNNWRAFYEIVSPEIRKDSTFEDFLKDSVHRHFKDAHELYRKFGFEDPKLGVLMERVDAGSDKRRT